MSNVKRNLPKDELKDEAIGVFVNGDSAAEEMNLAKQEVSIAAFRATFADVPDIKTIPLNLA